MALGALGGALIGGGLSALGGLFGGGSETEYYETNAQKQLRNLYTGILEDIERNLEKGYGRYKGVEAYPGTTVPETPGYLQNYLSGGAGSLTESPLYGAGSSILQTLLSGQPAYNTDMGAAEKYWNEAFYQPAYRQFTEDVLPQLREDFEGFGAFRSTARPKQELRATTDLLTNLQGQRAGLLWNELQAGRTAQESALNRALSALGPGMTYAQAPGQDITQRGLLQMQLDQAKMQEDYNKWLYSQPYNNPYLSMGMQSTQGYQPQPYVSQSTPWYSGLANMAGQVGGSILGTSLGGALGGSTASPFLSTASTTMSGYNPQYFPVNW